MYSRDLTNTMSIVSLRRIALPLLFAVVPFFSCVQECRCMSSSAADDDILQDHQHRKNIVNLMERNKTMLLPYKEKENIIATTLRQQQGGDNKSSKLNILKRKKIITTEQTFARFVKGVYDQTRTEIKTSRIKGEREEDGGLLDIEMNCEYMLLDGTFHSCIHPFATNNRDTQSIESCETSIDLYYILWNRGSNITFTLRTLENEGLESFLEPGEMYQIAPYKKFVLRETKLINLCENSTGKNTRKEIHATLTCCAIEKDQQSLLNETKISGHFNLSLT